ncbi:MAG: hypothetical protein PHO84_03025 [Dysgonamonadaceae bacterium]|nr:hypothetical protein [Dysgonamonadaceae bacterium]MDD4246108.1 hypothetical protein [Dysgonamonadaceae bacterium]MDD4606414.1 hypothetical protein [Dysgonamonadaceae bacterium]
MKKLFILLLISMGVLFSCTNVKESKEYKDLQAERDSLLMHGVTADTEVAEMMAVIDDVEENFNQIREAEKYLAMQSTEKGELSANTKQRINDNFKMINEILQKNKAQLAELNKKYSASSGQVGTLKRTIDRLNQQMEESAQNIVNLQTELSRRDETIAQLSTNVTELSGHLEEQSVTIREQEKSLNTAYYVFGTARELKDQKILSGGFLQSTKVLDGAFNKDYFLKIDIREVTRIPLYDKKGKLWSTHPEGTYEFEKGDDGNLTFVITDTQRFWSLTKYLIIEVG